MSTSGHDWRLRLALVLAYASSAACGSDADPVERPTTAPQAPDGGRDAGTAAAIDAARTTADDGGDEGFQCPLGGVRGSGRHRLFVQGHGTEPDERGVYPFLHDTPAPEQDALLCDDAVFVDDVNGDGIWQPQEEPLPLGPSGLVHGEHFLVGAGAYTEFEIVLCDDITGDVAFYVPNFDEEGSEALHQLFVVHHGEEQLVAEVIDRESGQFGYNPFVRMVQGEDPDTAPGDVLRMRSTNLNGVPFSVMVFSPPSEYESWVLVEVP